MWEAVGLTVPLSEQPAGLVPKMMAALQAYRAVHERNVYVLKLGKTDAEFGKHYPELRQKYKDIRELRKLMEERTLSNGE